MIDALSATIPIKELPNREVCQKIKSKETFLEDTCTMALKLRGLSSETILRDPLITKNLVCTREYARKMLESCGKNGDQPAFRYSL